METSRGCGCKGIRTCLICEKEFGIDRIATINKENGAYVYCPYCNKCWVGWDVNDYKQHPNHKGEPLDFHGIYIQLDFLTEQEELDLLNGIDHIPWDLSQSGRRKQNFGPKCNFKKHKLQIDKFKGFPMFSKFVQEKFETVDVLKNFFTIEQCSLEYNPDRGASIDPHIDDCWIWGERIVTVNLLSDSVLTMNYNEKPSRYNLNLVDTYSSVLDLNGCFNKSSDYFKIKYELDTFHPIIRIPMPRRSLLVMYNSARYEWEHQILREDIKERRICLAYREFTPPYLPNGIHQEKGKSILNAAKSFYDSLELNS